ncbi:MAG: enoyl-CoA hydratase/isomerase family protein [Actinomycetota bacterium]|nr:enoyl-CoA hydratase/isomerase family protein [Actinomycetota bacterium]
MPTRPTTIEELHRAATGDPAHDVPWDPADPRTVLVVDLDSLEPGDATAPIDTAIGAVVVGTTADPVAAIADGRAAVCDLAVACGDLDSIVATVEACPVAAASFVLLLRASGSRSVDDGLHAESAVYSTLQAGTEFTAWRQQREVRQREAQDGDAVVVERDGDTLTLTLNRPTVRNALNTALRDQLLSGLALSHTDATITEVHLRGAGPAFCSGGDLDEFGSFPDPARAHLVRLSTSIGRSIDRIRDRVVVHLHGPCAGSGIELPAFAGTVTADPATTFDLPEVSLGLIPGAGGTVSLPRRIGRHRTAELGLRGAPIDATTARRWGLVDAIEPR